MMSSLIFLVLSGLAGIAIGGICGFIETLASSPRAQSSPVQSPLIRIWSGIELGFIGKSLFALVILVVVTTPFTLAIALPVILYRMLALSEPMVVVLAYLVLFGGMWVGVLIGRRASLHRRRHAA